MSQRPATKVAINAEIGDKSVINSKSSDKTAIKVAQMFPTYDTINDTINGTISAINWGQLCCPNLKSCRNVQYIVQ